MASVITPVFNRWDLTEKFIKSVLPHLKETDELIIVDNASTDETSTGVPLLAANTNKRLRYHKCLENKGFGEGNNIGANLADTDVFIFISNDVIINGDFIRPVEEYLEKKPRAMIGDRLIGWPTGWNDVWDVTQTIGPIPYIQGYCMCLPRFAFFAVGGFDNKMFIDYEDVDLSFRLVQAGYGLDQINLPINHDSSGNSFQGLSDARMQFTLRSMERFGRKYGFKRIK